MTDDSLEYFLLFGDFVHSAASSPLPGSPCSALPHSNPCVGGGHYQSIWRFCCVLAVCLLFCVFLLCVCACLDHRKFCAGDNSPPINCAVVCCEIPWRCAATRSPDPKTMELSFSLTVGTLTSFPPSLWKEEGQFLMPRPASTEPAPPNSAKFLNKPVVTNYLGVQQESVHIANQSSKIRGFNRNHKKRP